MPRSPNPVVAFALAVVVAVAGPSAASAACTKFKKGTPITDCPADGCGTEVNLNRAKNRTTNASNPGAMTVADIVALNASVDPAWKGNMDRSPIEVVGEGKSVELEGYLLNAKQEGAENCNCKWKKFHDTHIWIVADAKGKKKSKAVVVEFTPRITVGNWDAKALKAAIKASKKATKTLPHVRVTGWLMLDTHHMHELLKSRATFWEVHPVTALEIVQ